MSKQNFNLSFLLGATLAWAAVALITVNTVRADRRGGNRGLEIAREADRRDSGFRDMRAEMTMILKNKAGRKSIRRLKFRSLEVRRDGDKTLAIFNQPRDLKGTAFLSYSHVRKADDQWLYMPALRRVKRISSRNKSGPFLGSEFAYEDLSSQEVDKYTYRFIRKERFHELDCFLVQRVPRDPYSGYKRQLVWLDAVHYRLRKVVYFDRKNSRLKTLTFSNYRKYAGRFWRAATMYMVNHQTGKSTEMQWRKYRFGTGLTPRDFDKSSLKRAR